MSQEMASTPALTEGLERPESIPPGAENQGSGPAAPPEAAASDRDPSEAKPKQELDMVEMGISFVSPALFGKLCLLYFGSMYSAHPGKGYGIGLAISILFTVTMLGRFAWRYRHYSED